MSDTPTTPGAAETPWDGFFKEARRLARLAEERKRERQTLSDESALTEQEGCHD